MSPPHPPCRGDPAYIDIDHRNRLEKILGFHYCEIHQNDGFKLLRYNTVTEVEKNWDSITIEPPELVLNYFLSLVHTMNKLSQHLHHGRRKFQNSTTLEFELLFHNNSTVNVTDDEVKNYIADYECKSPQIGLF